LALEVGGIFGFPAISGSFDLQAFMTVSHA
jgi:hypothetical protein